MRRLLLICALLSAGRAAASEPAPWSLQSVLGAQSPLSLSGTVRLRQEALHGQFRPGRGPNDQAWSLRTTLAASYRAPGFRVLAEVADGRLYGNDADSPTTTAEVNALELVQANAQAEFGTLTVLAGRYTLDVGSRRLVARNDFRNTTNAFTGVQLRGRDGDGRSLLLFHALPQRRLPDAPLRLRDNAVQFDEEDFDTRFSGLVVDLPLSAVAATLETYGYALDERDADGRATRDRELYTVGGRLLRAPHAGTVDVEIEGAYQFGSVSRSTAADAAVDEVSAHFAHAQAGWTFATRWQPRIALAADVASGDRAGSSSNNRFDTLYGARRWEYGPSAIFGLIGRANLRALEGRIEAHPTARIDTLIGWRANWLDARGDSFAASGVRDADGTSGRFAGHQIETRLRCWLVPARVRVEAGGALFVNGRFLDTAPNANGHGNPLYGYTMLAASF